MTPEKVIEVLASLKDTLLCELLDGTPPEQLDAEDYKNSIEFVSEDRAIQHFAWMCDEATKLVQQGRMEKAMRWLGFINGGVWMCGLLTLDEVKQLSAPTPVPTTTLDQPDPTGIHLVVHEEVVLPEHPNLEAISKLELTSEMGKKDD